MRIHSSDNLPGWELIGWDLIRVEFRRVGIERRLDVLIKNKFKTTTKFFNLKVSKIRYRAEIFKF